MTLQEIITLSNAGFSKTEILAMGGIGDVSEQAQYQGAPPAQAQYQGASTNVFTQTPPAQAQYQGAPTNVFTQTPPAQAQYQGAPTNVSTQAQYQAAPTNVSTQSSDNRDSDVITWLQKLNLTNQTIDLPPARTSEQILAERYNDMMGVSASAQTDSVSPAQQITVKQELPRIF